VCLISGARRGLQHRNGQQPKTSSELAMKSAYMETHFRMSKRRVL